MEIGQIIKKRREELGMSQEYLAQKTGYKSRSSINKIEVDGRGLPQSKILVFAKVLETTPAYLMGWDDDPISNIINGQEGLKSILTDIYGYAGDISVYGKYSECFYYQLGKRNDAFAISETDFNQLYESVKTTIQQFVSFIKCSIEEEHQSCLEVANTPPDKDLYKKLRAEGMIYPELEEKYGYPPRNDVTEFPQGDKSHLEVDAAHRRTDLPPEAHTEELKKQEDDIMDDSNF